jgi:integrin beta 3
MIADDLAAVVNDLAIETKAFVGAAISRAIAAISPRVEVLEAELLTLKALAPLQGPPGPEGPPGRDGDSVTLADIKATVGAALTAAIGTLPALVDDAVTKALAARPVPKDGRDGVNGKDLDLVAVKTFADAAATTALAGLPALVRVEIDRAVTALPAPVDLVKATVEAELKTWPRPKDGAPGPAGRDGTLEEVTAEHDGERTVTLVRKDGSRLVTITLPIPIDRGVWKPGTWYGKGDGVTWGGSFWIAQEATNAKPGESGADSRAWRLAVKRGTDGKAGRDGKDRE